MPHGLWRWRRPYVGIAGHVVEAQRSPAELGGAQVLRVRTAAPSAVAADLHLLIQFLVHRAPHAATFIARHVGRQIARSRLPMPDGRLPAGVGGRWWRIGLAGRRRTLAGRRGVL